MRCTPLAGRSIRTQKLERVRIGKLRSHFRDEENSICFEHSGGVRVIPIDDTNTLSSSRFGFLYRIMAVLFTSKLEITSRGVVGNWSCSICQGGIFESQLFVKESITTRHES